jgi:hypothetical protein
MKSMVEKPTVRLTSDEIHYAAIAGVLRHHEALRDNRGPTHGQDAEYDWRQHIEGALSECALAKYLNVFWPGKGVIFGRDLGENEARWTIYPTGRLILHKDDGLQHPDSKFYLLTGANGLYTIHGWVYAHEGKKQEFWCDPTKTNRPAYFVPQSALHPVNEQDDVIESFLRDIDT